MKDLIRNFISDVPGVIGGYPLKTLQRHVDAWDGEDKQFVDETVNEMVSEGTLKCLQFGGETFYNLVSTEGGIDPERLNGLISAVSENSPVKDHPVLKQACIAYCDCSILDYCNDDVNATEDQFEDYAEPFMVSRNLHWRASQSVSPQIAYEIMKIACPGYNSFEAEIIRRLDPCVRVTLAREGSVCMYVTGDELPAPYALGEDECDTYDEDKYHTNLVPKDGGHEWVKTNLSAKAGETRMWWD